jgi:putative membrane protein
MNTKPCTRRPVQLRLVASLFVLSLAAVCTTPGRAADTTVPLNRTDKSALKHTDRNFVEKAARSGREEVEISRIAAERTSNPAVRKFAEMVVSDHERANSELASLAASRGVDLPAKDAHENKWAKRDAKDFDVDYLKKMVSDHEDAIKLFRKESTDGADSELVAFARQILPKLEHHLEQANDLKKQLKD